MKATVLIHQSKNLCLSRAPLRLRKDAKRSLIKSSLRQLTAAGKENTVIE
jgi:hypothetical protein